MLISQFAFLILPGLTVHGQLHALKLRNRIRALCSEQEHNPFLMCSLPSHWSH